MNSLSDNSINIDLDLLIDIDDISSKELENLEPMNIDIVPWLYEKKNGYYNDLYFKDNRGKWMLFFDKSNMNQKWKESKELFRNGKIKEVEYIKCSTNYKNVRASNDNIGLISFYCNNSDNKEKILSVGNSLIKLLNYSEYGTIYYKTDELSKLGTRSLGNTFNYLYKLNNELYMFDDFID